jgi:hypothetical protein
VKNFLLFLSGLAIGALLSGCSGNAFGQKDEVSLLEYEKCLEALNSTSSNEPYNQYLRDFEEKMSSSENRYELTLRLCNKYRP